MNSLASVLLLGSCVVVTAHAGSSPDWKHLPLPACGGVPVVEDTAPETVVRWLDAYFLELAAVFPVSTQRIVRDVYFHGAFVHTTEGLARTRGKIVTADLINTGSEVVPFVQFDRAVARHPLLRRAALLPQLLGELATRHAESERLGIARAYRRADRPNLVAWSRLVTATVERRLYDALVAVDWPAAAKQIEDMQAREVLEARLLALESGEGLRSLASRKLRRGRAATRDVRAFERRLAVEESLRPCSIADRLEIPNGAFAGAPFGSRVVPTVTPKSALEAARAP